MTQIQLRYGKQQIEFEFEANRFQILTKDLSDKPLSDAEINSALDAPIDSETLENSINASETVLIVVPDATRQAASGQIVNLIVRRLIANGVMPFDISIIFATGIHRLTTIEEKKSLVTPFIFQRVKTLDHNARDLMQIINLGETKRGTAIELNRALVEHDKIILIGGVNFHYFAGFGGGRKLICPGLASAKTANQTHKLAFDFERKKRRENAETAILAGNSVHAEFIEIAAKINPAFAVNSIVDEAGNAVRIFAGNWHTAHEKACAFYAANYSINIAEKRETVIVSCGGAPFDVNLIQAHKALEIASHACADGGTIIWLAECADGTGRADFINWFDAANADELSANLEKKYQINGQTAWALFSKIEKFDVRLISALPETETRRLRLQTARNIEEVLAEKKSGDGYILPFGAKFLPRII